MSSKKNYFTSQFAPLYGFPSGRECCLCGNNSEEYSTFIVDEDKSGIQNGVYGGTVLAGTSYPSKWINYGVRYVCKECIYKYSFKGAEIEVKILYGAK